MEWFRVKTCLFTHLFTHTSKFCDSLIVCTVNDSTMPTRVATERGGGGGGGREGVVLRVNRPTAHFANQEPLKATGEKLRPSEEDKYSSTLFLNLSGRMTRCLLPFLP